MCRFTYGGGNTNKRLPTEKVPSTNFRTGVRLPSDPPKRQAHPRGGLVFLVDPRGEPPLRSRIGVRMLSAEQRPLARRWQGQNIFANGETPLGSTRKRLRIGDNSESFSTKSTLSGGINRIHDEIPLAWDEIRLDGGWVDLIPSKQCLDFICYRQISWRSDFILASGTEF